MLLKVLRQLVGRARPEADTVSLPELLEKAHALGEGGDSRAAIRAYRAYLERDPTNIQALNGLGACLAYIGDNAQAAQVFELAYSMDDTFIPAMTNHAKLLVDDNRGDEAMAFLRRARIAQPAASHTFAVYAGLRLRHGNAADARAWQLKSWLATFDNLRMANCYLFWTAYDDVDEALVAAEHRFWAETLLVPPLPDDAAPVLPAAPAGSSRRIRIGYWSPDFRSHSVRYFFRPLLDAHDRNRFEIFAYHDFPGSDGHTEAVREQVEHFHDVSELVDAELLRLIRSHQLDVLVELAGHTSHNRLSLLSHRLARVQVTGLGYPLTTGLRTIDAKVLDRHVVTPAAPRYYSEEPLALPTSFWCFDPKEEIAVAAHPPVVARGSITFGCFGNIAKVTRPVLAAWREILQAVAGSRLLVRSISFLDAGALREFRLLLQAQRLPMERVELLPPVGGVDLFRSYDEIDIILDTFPFNGGTTTSFAVHMGVPVVTLAGGSLLGRMGASILGNVGAADLVVDTLEQYVARAVALANDTPYLQRFRSEIRERLQATGLGNPERFTREFEDAVAGLVERPASEAGRWRPQLAALPAPEIMRRAYAVLRTGQTAAANRIIDHCLREYPDCGTAHVLRAQQITWDGRYQDAIDYLEQRWAAFATGEQVAALLSIARQYLLAGDRQRAAAALDRLPPAIEDEFDADQARLLRAACSSAAGSRSADPRPLAARALRVVVPCDDPQTYEAVRQSLQQAAVPTGWSLRVERVREAARLRAYEEWRRAGTGEVLLVVHKNARIANAGFLAALGEALEAADVVGFAGASRWARLDWRLDDFAAKAGGFVTRSAENAAMAELHLVGHGPRALQTGLQVLDGTVLALAPSAPEVPWDEDLVGCETLLEEVWTHFAARAGARLAAHRGLGVFVDPEVKLDGSNHTEARVHASQLLGLEPFAHVREDFLALSVPVPDSATAVAVADRYLESAP